MPVPLAVFATRVTEVAREGFSHATDVRVRFA